MRALEQKREEILEVMGSSVTVNAGDLDILRTMLDEFIGVAVRQQPQVVQDSDVTVELADIETLRGLVAPLVDRLEDISVLMMHQISGDLPRRART